MLPNTPLLSPSGPAVKYSVSELDPRPPPRVRVHRQSMAVGIEDIHKAMAWPRHVVVFLSVLFRVGHEQVAIDVRDAKRRVAGGNIGIGEAAVRSRGREQAVRAGRPEYIDRPGAEVGRVQEPSLGAQAEHETLVDGAVPGGGRRRVVDRD